MSKSIGSFIKFVICAFVAQQGMRFSMQILPEGTARLIVQVVVLFGFIYVVALWVPRRSK